MPEKQFTVTGFIHINIKKIFIYIKKKADVSEAQSSTY